MKLFAAIVLLLLPQVLPGGDARRDGRRGNGHYEADRYEEAANAYRSGLATYDADEAPDAVFYGLQNNLGAALYRQQEWAPAAEAFARARDAAATPADHARAAYNAGNTAYYQQQLDAALSHYREALLADPTDEKAKYNYEFVKRRLEEQQQQDQQQQQQQQQQQGDGENEDQQNQDQQDQQDQQNQDQQQDGDEQQDENQEQQDGDQQDEQQQQEQQQEQQQQPQPSDEEQLSREQAERILQALENEEEQLLREVQKVKGRPRRVEKDW